jgi:hypothetical protein
MPQPNESDLAGVDVTSQSGRKPEKVEKRHSVDVNKVLGIAVIIAVTGFGILRVLAENKNGTTATSLGSVQPGHEKLRVDHRFTDSLDESLAAQRAMYSVLEKRPEILYDPATINVELFDGHHEPFLAQGNHIVFTVDTETRQQSAIEEKAKEAKERAEAKPVEVESKGDGTFGFTLFSQLYPDVVIARTITEFRKKHPGLDFTVVNMPHHIGNTAYEDRDSYLIVPTPKQDIVAPSPESK